MAVGMGSFAGVFYIFSDNTEYFPIVCTRRARRRRYSQYLLIDSQTFDQFSKDFRFHVCYQRKTNNAFQVDCFRMK